MAGSRIKGITIELDGDTTKLTEALKKVDAQVRTTQSQLKDVNKLLKEDPGNKDLLSQKYKYLGTEIDATKKKLDTLKEAQKQMGSEKVGTEQYEALQREIEATEQKLKGLTKEYENFGSVSAQQIAAAGDKVQQVGDKISSAGTKMTAGVTVPIVAGATAAVNAYGDVDKQFNLVKQTMGTAANSAADFQKLWEQMGTSAKNSVYGMQDAADALLNFARQGFTAKQATDMLTPAMSLAAGTGTDLSTVTAGLGNALKMFGANSDEAANYADVLAKAQAQANTDTTQLFDAMSVAGPICKTVGWNMKDLAAITDVFGNAGISGSEGANALKTGLARLASPAKSGAEAMDALGLSTGQTYAIFNDNGTLKDMPTVLQNLNSAFSGLSDQEKLEAASNIFGKNQMAKWLTLIQTSPSDIKGLRDALDDVSGSADDMANALMSGTGGTIEQLKSTFDVLTVTVGQLVAPAFTKVMQAVIDCMNAIMNMNPAAQKLTLILLGIAAAIGPILIVIGKMATGVGALMKLAPAFAKIPSVISTVKGAVSGLWGVLSANPIVLVIAAIAALVAGFVYLWNTSESFRNFWTGLWDGIKSIVSDAVEAVKGFFSQIGDFFSSMGELISNVWNTITNVVQTGIMLLGSILQGAAQILLLPWSFIWENFGPILTKAWEGIKSTVSTALSAVGGFISNAWTSISSVTNSVWSAISSFFSSIWNTISGVFSSVLGVIQSAVSTAWNAVSGVTSSVWNTISSVISSVWNAISSKISSVLSSIQNVMSTVWNAIKNIVTGAINAVKDTISNGLNAAKNAAGNILDGIKGKFSSVMDGAKSIVKGALDRISSFFSNCKLQLPHIKLPHFSISGKLSIDPPSVPHLSIDWYKKAMDDAYLLNSPTIFGAANGRLLGGGEAGQEAVVGTDKLVDIVQTALAGICGGTTVIPVYIGQERIDEIVVRASQRAAYRSGGR